MPPILNAAKLRTIREKQGEDAYLKELAVPWRTEAEDIASLMALVSRHGSEPSEDDSAGPMPRWFVEASWGFITKYGRSKGGAILLKVLARLNRPIMP